MRSDTDGTTVLGVKGGSWESERTECRTEYREEGRDASKGYEDVGFRVIQVKNGEEPEQVVALTTLDAPTVTAASNSEDSIILSWASVNGAIEYQIYEYSEKTSLLTMLNRTTDTTVTMENLEPGSTHSYIVQPISYVEIADNVSPEYRVTATCGQEQNVENTSSLLTQSETIALEENTQEPDNMMIPIVIGCIVIAGVACIIIIALMKKKR